MFKVLKFKYGKNAVTYIRNITDVDDKIIKSSLEKNIPILELTKNIIESFTNDCNYLNCERPPEQPKTTDHMVIMITMIAELIEKGCAYESNNT